MIFHDYLLPLPSKPMSPEEEVNLKKIYERLRAFAKRLPPLEIRFSTRKN